MGPASPGYQSPLWTPPSSPNSFKNFPALWAQEEDATQKEVEAFFMSAEFFLFTITFGDLSYTVCMCLMCHIDSVST